MVGANHAYVNAVGNDRLLTPVLNIKGIAGSIMNTELPTIFTSTLGLCSPWKITEALFSKQEKRLDLFVYFMGDKFCPCPFCGSQITNCLTNIEIWHHGSFLNYSTYLHARVPQIECCGNIIPLDRPWSRSGSKFSRIG